MKVIIEITIDKCKDCPFIKYEGTAWSEDVYTCTKLDTSVDTEAIHSNCPFIETTINRLNL